MMTTRPLPEPEPTSLDVSVLHQLETEAEALRDRLAAAREEPSTDAEPLIAALETAHEELRVAGEEVRTQHETICRLMSSHRSLRLQQERTLGILPVPAFTTDMHGTITSVNAAASLMLQTRIPHLLGKPLVSLFSQDDRHELRRLIARRGLPQRHGEVIRRAVTLLQRRGGPALVELTGSVQLMPAAQGEIAWFLLSSDGLAPAGLSEALAELATLPRRDMDRSSVLSAAVAICASVLDAHVTVALGPPEEPSAVASSSQLAQACDGAQLGTGSGPSLSAGATGRTVVSTSLAADTRWSALARHLPGDVGAAVATPVVLLEDVAGTLTAYASKDGTVDAESAVILAQTLGGILHELDLQDEVSRMQEDMERALTSRSTIDQAKGIIMASLHVDAEGAWEHLVHLGSTQERKVRDVAAEIVDTVRQD